MTDTYDELRQLKAERREKHRELTREYDEAVYLPKLREIRERCQHPHRVIIPMMTGQHIYVACASCSKQLWKGHWDDIPEEYKNARVAKAFR